MNMLVFGATGRVGRALVEDALSRGHQVTVVVRDSSKMSMTNENLIVLTGKIGEGSSLPELKLSGFDALVNVIGVDPLKPSTVVTEGARELLALAQEKGIPRYLGITGTAQMPNTFLGWLTSSILRTTPVGNAVRDHDGAISLVKASALQWHLIGCPYIADGKKKGKYREATVFGGGFKVIHPGDVAQALIEEAESPRHTREILGIWY